jgi:hypothetical protein
VIGEGAQAGKFVVGQGAGETGAGGYGFENVVDADSEFGDACRDAKNVGEAADLIVEPLDAGADFAGVGGGEGVRFAIELDGFGGNTIGDLAKGVGGDANQGSETEVGFAEFVEAADDGFGGAAADSGLLGGTLPRLGRPVRKRGSGGFP